MTYNNIEEKIYACWMSDYFGVSRKKIHEIVRAAGTYREAYRMSDRLLTTLIGEEALLWKKHREKCNPEVLYEAVVKKEVGFTYYGATDFPEKLTKIPDVPIGLFYLGSLPKAETPAVAMIGARRNSDYGRCMAEYFADRLARAGITVISGMAMGIDGISQRSALKAGGISYGILGGGVDMIYPPSNERLYYQLIEKGGVISEYIPGTEPRPMFFPQRNRIISGLSDAVLVVEAREKSGTLITVDMALEQGREVYAIPGRCSDGLSMGCNRLLRQGAGIAVTPEDLIEDLGWNRKPDNREVSSFQYELSDVAGQLVQVLDVTPCTQDDIVSAFRIKQITYTIPEICRGLLELEMKQIVSRTGGQYRLTKPKIG